MTDHATFDQLCDLHDDALDRLQVGRLDTRGFAVRAVRVQVEGVCPECRLLER